MHKSRVGMYPEGNQSTLVEPGYPCVMVVDHMPESRRAVIGALEKAGMTALIAPSGQAALTLLRDVSPDLIIMNVVMPGLDGFETTARVKSDPGLSHIPVIFMTSLTETEHVLRGLELGAVDCVAKPLVIDELMARVRVHLKSAREGRAMRLALDSGQRPTIGINPEGTLLWYTPAAASLLSGVFPRWRPNELLPEPLRNMLCNLAMRRPLMRRKTITLNNATEGEIEEGSLECILAGTMEDGSVGVTLLLRRSGEEERLLSSRYNLTTREAQVLLWVSRGKPNRDISKVLGISSRTVNKHLEQIFAKLGVENRASAAVIAVRALNG